MEKKRNLVNNKKSVTLDLLDSGCTSDPEPFAKRRTVHIFRRYAERLVCCKRMAISRIKNVCCKHMVRRRIKKRVNCKHMRTSLVWGTSRRHNDSIKKARVDMKL
ncbi:hypothetical protein ACROYT_G040957 [Oculina patagonica]